MAVETYSHVMHIVSSVSGTLREEVGAMDALRSVLPAGTLSGAPKVRAMQIIDELEPIKRGGYGGAIGYLSYTGDLDTCIHIRTVVIKDGVAHVQAGGGTVADAKPAYEFVESEAKAQAVLRRDRAGAASSRTGHERSSSSTTTTRSPTTSSSTWASWGRELEVVRNDRATVDELLERELRPRRRLAGAVHAQRGRHLASRSMRRFPEAGVPTLGVCLGHQSLAQAFGGTVVRHVPVHGKTTDDRARRPHDLRRAARAADRRALPLAGRRRGRCPTASRSPRSGGGVLMGIRHRELPAEGVQFHPESVLTDDGQASCCENFLGLVRSH